MDPYVLKTINAERVAGRACVHMTELKTGRDRVIKSGLKVPGALGGAVRQAFETGQSGLVHIDGAHYFLNVHAPLHP